MDARTADEMDEETLLNHAMNHLSKKGYFCRREVRTPLQKIDMVATRGDETLVIEAESSSEANRVKQGFRQLANVKPYMGLSARYILLLPLKTRYAADMAKSLGMEVWGPADIGLIAPRPGELVAEVRPEYAGEYKGLMEYCLRHMAGAKESDSKEMWRRLAKEWRDLALECYRLAGEEEGVTSTIELYERYIPPEPEEELRVQGVKVTPTTYSCFIATAAYGTPFASEVDALRAFRDRVLSKSRAGRLAVKAYYCVSPPIASLVEKDELLRCMVRLLFTPIVRALRWFELLAGSDT
jgi:hypothetical protein